jgi:pimeloyl-ACP methyl ester carboxylesterase
VDPMVEALRLRTNGVELHALAAGPPDGPLAILLHGFPESSHGWRRQLAPLAAAGLRVLAPDQRGYALSDKPLGRAAYVLDTLADDVLGLADALGRHRFAVVGHDWGGAVAWHLAARDPGRVERAAILNAPHPATVGAYARAHPGQALKSWYIAFFQAPAVPELALSTAGHAWLRRAMIRSSRPGTFTPEDLRRYREDWSRPDALTAMLNWYRALPLYAPLPAPDPRRRPRPRDLGRPRRVPGAGPRRGRARAVRPGRGVPPPGRDALGPARGAGAGERAAGRVPGPGDHGPPER